MGDNIAMAKPGTQFSGDGISISWSRNLDGTPGRRDVRAVPPGRRSPRVRRMMIGDERTGPKIVEVEDEATPETQMVTRGTSGPRRPISERLFGGGTPEAKRVFDATSGPIVRRIFVPVGELEEREAPESPPAERGGGWPEKPVEAVATPHSTEPSRGEKVDLMVDLNTRAELDKMATAQGIDPSGFRTKLEVAEAIVEGAP